MVILRLKIVGSLCPVSQALIVKIKTINVEVLIPPPVDPGEAPMNIKNIIIKTVGKDKNLVDIVLKPAVRAVID